MVRAGGGGGSESATHLDDATCLLRERGAEERQARQFPGAAMVPPCRGAGAAGAGWAGVGIPAAKRSLDTSSPTSQSWFPEEMLGKA